MQEEPKLTSNFGATSNTTRRSVLRGTALALGRALAAPFTAAAEPLHRQATHTSGSFVPVLDPPDSITLFAEDALEHKLERTGETWHGSGCSVTARQTTAGLILTLESSLPTERVRLRWRTILPAHLRILGDAWERSYGELGWREIVPERPLPWYFLAHDGTLTHGYGVLTGASAFAFWQCDPEGVTLWLDVRNGGRGVLLGPRQLVMATVVARPGHPGETPMAAARTLCRRMCPQPRPSTPIYGSNDWYYAYGHSSASDILRDADLLAELAPTRGPRPFTVADEGWANPKTFPDMAALAAGIRAKSVRPGIWIRPLLAASTDGSLLIPAARFKNASDAQETPAFDPTIPESLDRALAKVRQVRAWGYELIKHDFSTYDLLGQWGFAMDASPALPGWSFHDRTRTSAEIIRAFYQAIRTEGGDAVVVGCNTVGHLSAGLFESQRIGDDVSGRTWERTRRMGVNTLAFRLPQHGAFFCADPDCIPLTAKIPWSLTRQWLELVARSGAALVISPEAGSLGPEQKEAIRAAFALAANGGEGASPADWLDTHSPSKWEVEGRRTQYHWLEPSGACPFAV